MKEREKDRDSQGALLDIVFCELLKDVRMGQPELLPGCQRPKQSSLACPGSRGLCSPARSMASPKHAAAAL